jgi:hypothetical protein
MKQWLAASVYAVRGWWWLGWELGLWLSPRRAWRFAHQNHDWKKGWLRSIANESRHEHDSDL